MSANHHGDQKALQTETMQRFLDQVNNRAKRAYPNGRAGAMDDGELAYAIAADHERKIVIIDFAKPVGWMGLEPDQAIELGEVLIKKAKEFMITKDDDEKALKSLQDLKATLKTIGFDVDAIKQFGKPSCRS